MIDLAQPSDLAFIYDTHVQSQQWHYQGPRKAIRAWLVAELGLMLQHGKLPRGVTLVASDDGASLGWITAWKSHDGEREVVAINGLYVKSAFRRQGIASSLVNAARQLLGGERMVYTCRAYRQGRRWAERLGAECAS